MSYLDDPRVFFAAERTLLAWQRTAVALIGLGFVVERFGLFVRMLNASHTVTTETTAPRCGLAWRFCCWVRPYLPLRRANTKISSAR